MEPSSRRSFLRYAAAGGSAFSLPSLSAAVQTTTSPYRRPKLKITDVRTAFIQSQNIQLHVRIYTDQGIWGEGEATDAAIGGAAIINGVTSSKAVAALGQQSVYFGGMRSSLIGKDPLNVDAIWEQLRTGGIFAGAQGGQYITALSAVEAALWDLTGKALGLPIYQLLGGKFRDRIRVYCDGAENRGDTQSKEYNQRILEMGFTAVKTDISYRRGGGGRGGEGGDGPVWTAKASDYGPMVDAVAFVRDFFPKTVDIAVDLHAGGDVGSAKRLAKKLEPFDLMWLEEPVPPENIDAMRDIRESTSTPICCGENIFLRHGFRELLEKRAVDIIMPDLQKCGGLLEGRKIADMAAAYYVPFAPHCCISPLGQMASCHVCASVPNFLALEWHWFPRLPQWRNFVKEGEIIEKGYITVSDRPGVGVEVNDEAAKKYMMPGTTWFEPV
jgi:galactonate dehydratase